MSKDASQRPVGIRDVAKAAGVSVATASLALNGQPGVAEETRRRIVAVAEQLGYRANPQAQALRRGRTTTYGFVVRNFANPFFLEVLSGAQQVAADSGATLAGAGLALLARARAPACPGDGGAAGGRAGHRPGRPGRVDPAVAGAASRRAGGRAERFRRRHHRRVPGRPGQRGRGRAAHAPAGRARPHLGCVPVRAASPHGRPGPAAPFPPPGPRARPAAAGHATRRWPSPTCSRRPGSCWPTPTPRPRSSPTPTTRRSPIYKAARELSLPVGPGVSVRRPRRSAHLRAARPTAGHDPDGSRGPWAGR